MKALLYSGIVGAIAFVGVDHVFVEKATDTAPLNATVEAGIKADTNTDVADTSSIGTMTVALSHDEALPLAEGPAVVDLPEKEPEKDQSRLEEDDTPPSDQANATPPKADFSYLAYYAYSEIPPEVKPAEVVLNSLKGTPVGTPVEEIKRASDAFGMDFGFMKAVAKIKFRLRSEAAHRLVYRPVSAQPLRVRQIRIGRHSQCSRQCGGRGLQNDHRERLV